MAKVAGMASMARVVRRGRVCYLPQALGFDAGQQRQLVVVLSAILLLSNIGFTASGADAAMADGTTPSDAPLELQVR